MEDSLIPSLGEKISKNKKIKNFPFFGVVSNFLEQEFPKFVSSLDGVWF
jgi:hypothetical protein